MKIVDGYNVIGAAETLGLSLSREDKEEGLLRLLSSCRALGKLRGKILVVFDGHYGRLAEGPKKTRRGDITVEWAVGESADDVIVRRVRQSRNPRGIEVVTSDERVLRKVRQARAKGTRSGELVKMIADLQRREPALEKPDSLSPEEVKEWLALFGEDDEPSDR